MFGWGSIVPIIFLEVSLLVLDSLYFSHVHTVRRVHTESQYAWIDLLHLLLSLFLIHGVLRVLLSGALQHGTWLIHTCGPNRGRSPRNRHPPHACLQINNRKTVSFLQQNLFVIPTKSIVIPAVIFAALSTGCSLCFRDTIGLFRTSAFRFTFNTPGRPVCKQNTPIS